MVKKIFALLAVICIVTTLSGCSANPRSSKEYECGEFKFQINGKYKEEFAWEYSYLFSRNSDDISIYITNTDIHCADIKLWLDKYADSIADEKNDNNITSTDIVTDLDCKYAAGAVHCEYSDGTGQSYYSIENETKGLTITAEYKLSAKDRVCRDIEELVKSAEYTSNFRVYTGYYDVKKKNFAVTMPKEWYYQEVVFESQNKYAFDFGKTRARTAEEMNTNIMIMMFKNNSSSPADNADKDIESLEKEGYEARRFKSEIFGKEAECTEAKKADSDIIVRAYYFEYADLLWHINLNYSNDDELTDIEDFLSRIVVHP